VTNLGIERNPQAISLHREADRSPLGGRDASGREAAELALDAALGKKALEPVLLDVAKLCSYTDYILIVSARSDRQVGAITDAIVSTLKEHGHRPLGLEGATSSQWALLDYGDLIVHVFHHPTREFYDLESLWADADRVSIDVPDEARVLAHEPVY
jgi:ribosome-associated protein